MSLQGRTVLVTGSGGGLGRDIVMRVGAAGAHVILSDFDEALAQSSLEALRAAGGSGEVRLADLSDPASIAALGESLKGPLHGLINNGAIATGIGGIGFRDIDIATWDKVMQVNVRGTWLMIRACADALIASGSGRVVNLASDTALWGAPNLLSYTSSKGAVMAMTRSLAREMGPDGVGVTAIAPGILTTESTDYVPAERHELYETRRAVPGKQGTREVADVAAFLVSEPAITLTGQILPVDHGFHLR